MFHVVTHAFFKSLLFLAAGSVIHALHGDQNRDHMGGLRKDMPVTFWAMCIGGLTLAAIPGSSAFFSKDLILEAGVASGHTFITVIGLLTSLLTAFYGWRLVSLVFFRSPRHHRTAVHEAPPSMRVPMAVLASCCILAGWIIIPNSGLSAGAVPIMLTSGIASILAVLAAWYLYVVNPGIRTPLDRRFAALLRALRNRWYIDAVYEEHIVEGFVFRTAYGAAIADSRIVDAVPTGTATVTGLLSRASGWTDSSVVDGLVRGTASAVRFFSWPLRAVQAGLVQTYILFFVAGAIVALAFCLTR
jgi:NADH-quinone oxidoreductase subunit L